MHSLLKEPLTLLAMISSVGSKEFGGRDDTD
jgi:hypothetical protein